MLLISHPRRLLRDRLLPAVRTPSARRTATQRAAESYRARSTAVLRISVGVLRAGGARAPVFTLTLPSAASSPGTT
ncbi:hypothetical protein [Streptomyces sp. SAI-097]|jgi:hypothetical protein